MNDLVDPKAELKERRGKMLPVLCVLSWVCIGLWTLSTVNGLVEGKMSEEEITEQKYQLLEAYDEDMEFGQSMIEESVILIELQNKHFELDNFATLAIILIGFISVLLMYKLKKIGFYLYIFYSIAPVLLYMFLYPGLTIIKVAAVLFSFFSILFIILYGTQLKRMA